MLLCIYDMFSLELYLWHITWDMKQYDDILWCDMITDTDMMIEFLSDNSDNSPLGGGEGAAYVHLTQCQKGMAAPGQRISWPECIPWRKLT